MNKRRIVSVIAVCILSAVSIFAQENVSAPKSGEKFKIAKGVINGSAVNLVKPAYPPAAKAVKAEGSVSVQVTIDEEGNVISAEAVSGHPLLQNASVEAARQSKFKPTMLSGQAVRVTGIIVYNFVADTSGAATAVANWYNAGRNLGSLEKGASLRFSYPSQLNTLLQNDWSLERGYLQTLDDLRKAEFEAAQSSPDKVTDETVERVITQPDGTQKTVKVTTNKILLSSKASPEQISATQGLISALRSRLSANQTDLWNFNVGITLSQIMAAGKTEELRSQIQFAPSDIAPELIAELNKFLTIAEDKKLSVEARSQMSDILFNINRLQSAKK